MAALDNFPYKRLTRTWSVLTASLLWGCEAVRKVTQELLYMKLMLWWGREPSLGQWHLILIGWLMCAVEPLLIGFPSVAFTKIGVLRGSMGTCCWLSRSTARKFANAKSKRAENVMKSYGHKNLSGDGIWKGAYLVTLWLYFWEKRKLGHLSKLWPGSAQ